MLDQTTKRKLDSARQILVGKVPDPKAQVEQITTALVYKFMDDMDKEAEELGGEAKFFANGFAQYSWTKLMDPKLSGADRLDLYVQAITNMSKNPHIPQLFRDIFKGAFLPYNDPRTLSLFLKEINEFNYEHSENLGNAFEYLLSILGSQGDAGQFRTPRHIIDFIVEVVDPKKNETILDPACGTAGFLISAYKHILKTNKEKSLTPDERSKMMSNFAGYDISPDMVKLALVNLYLHGFPEPKIYEYDTLTSEKHWDETFDVILANPPFMTPKGGINPHKRFSIQANRAEVLFVDYIMEHLTIKGRAGIIVPEGIIFQSSNAYKALRKKLVEDGLLAVVSLPSGVFQPYSGVKTSILIIDREFAKKTKNLLFININHTGISLGATNMPIKDNDLPQALTDIKNFYDYKQIDSSISFTIKKERTIVSNYDLSASKYRPVKTQDANTKIVTLKEIAKINKGKSSSTKTLQGEYPLILTAEKWKTADHFDFDGDGVAVPLISALGHGKADIKRVHKVTGKFALANLLAFINPNRDVCLPDYLFYTLDYRKKEMANLMYGAANVSMKVSDLEDFSIPLPPLSVQKEIVEQIEVKQNAINAAREVIKNLERERRYFGQSLRKLEGVEWVELGEVCEVVSGGGFPKKEQGSTIEEIPFLKVSDMNIDGNSINIKNWNNTVSRQTLKNLGVKSYPAGTVIFPKIGAAIATNKKRILTKESAFDNNVMGLVPSDKILSKYLYILLLQIDISIWASRTALPSMRKTVVEKYKIPLPSLEIQKQLVAEAEKEQEIIDANKRLIEIMEKKIEAVLSEI